MRILAVHNEYEIETGEEVMIARIMDLLKQRGHNVITFIRSSAEIPNILFGKIYFLKKCFKRLAFKRHV